MAQMSPVMVVSAKGVHFTIRSDRNIAFGKSQKYHCKFFAVGDIFPFSLIWFPHCKTCLAPQNDFGMQKFIGNFTLSDGIGKTYISCVCMCIVCVLGGGCPLKGDPQQIFLNWGKQHQLVQGT